MRVLMISPTSPLPADTGGRQRVFHAARCMAQTDDVTICVLVETENQWASLEQLRTMGIRVIGVRHNRSRLLSAAIGLALREPMHVARYRSRDLKSVVHQILSHEHFDLVWCHFLHTIENVPNTNIPLVLDLQNVDERVWSGIAQRAPGTLTRLLAVVNARAWGAYQRRELQRAEIVLAPSAEEVSQVAAIVGSPERVWLAPNGVSSEDPPQPDPKRGYPPVVLVCGSMQVWMNEDGALWLGREVWPAVRRSVPDAELWLVGGHPGRRVRQLSRLSGVKVLGWVPDVRPYYARATIAAIPARFGGGTKLKTLEAMNYAMPIVATGVGVQGLEVCGGEHMLLADTHSEFANAVVRLLQDAHLRTVFGERARALARERYDWDQLYGGVRKQLHAHLSKASPSRGSTGILGKKDES